MLVVVVVFGFGVGMKAGAAGDRTGAGAVVFGLGGVHGIPASPSHCASAPCPNHLPTYGLLLVFGRNVVGIVVGVSAVAIAGLDAIGVSLVLGCALADAAFAQCLRMHSCIAAGSPMCAAICFHVALSCARVRMSLRVR